MAIFLRPADFDSGDLRIAYSQYSEAALQSVIDETEAVRLAELLGPELAGLLKSDYAEGAGFSEPRFTSIFDPFTYVLADAGILSIPLLIHSVGIKKYLMLFAYFEYLRRDIHTSRETGLAKAASENAESATGIGVGLHLYYNSAIRTGQAIQEYILKNESGHLYPEFQGVKQRHSSWI